jgi:hypothetical protein
MRRGRIKNKVLTVKYFRGELHFAGIVTWDFFAEIISSEPFGGGGPIRDRQK